MELPTTLLRHDAPPDGTPPHYDWLVLDPLARRDSAAGLWTVRVSAHWRDWASLGRVELTPLPRHRRRYLSWSGRLTGQRGWVRPAGTGRVHVQLWTPGRIELILHPDPPPYAPTNPLALSLRPVGSGWYALVAEKPFIFCARCPRLGAS